mmetsp:Transcript_71718/g.164343  ORF Transcript_71718/g.164343 Transcript_71718/m.164343 type:complete len:572 (+) Transcript_71718:229-1944(+)
MLQQRSHTRTLAQSRRLLTRPASPHTAASLHQSTTPQLHDARGLGAHGERARPLLRQHLRVHHLESRGRAERGSLALERLARLVLELIGVVHHRLAVHHQPRRVLMRGVQRFRRLSRLQGELGAEVAVRARHDVRVRDAVGIRALGDMLLGVAVLGLHADERLHEVGIGAVLLDRVQLLHAGEDGVSAALGLAVLALDRAPRQFPVAVGVHLEVDDGGELGLLQEGREDVGRVVLAPRAHALEVEANLHLPARRRERGGRLCLKGVCSARADLARARLGKHHSGVRVGPVPHLVDSVVDRGLLSSLLCRGKRRAVRLPLRPVLLLGLDAGGDVRGVRRRLRMRQLLGLDAGGDVRGVLRPRLRMRQLRLVLRDELRGLVRIELVGVSRGGQLPLDRSHGNVSLLLSHLGVDDGLVLRHHRLLVLQLSGVRRLTHGLLLEVLRVVLLPERVKVVVQLRAVLLAGTLHVRSVLLRLMHVLSAKVFLECAARLHVPDALRIGVVGLERLGERQVLLGIDSIREVQRGGGRAAGHDREARHARQTGGGSQQHAAAGAAAWGAVSHQRGANLHSAL